MNNDICEAINNKRIIEFYYDGGTRVVEPYCYGVSTKGNKVLRGYQIDGYSSSGGIPSWRLFKEDSMGGILITKKEFIAVRPEYNPNDKAMIQIFCNI